MDDFDLEQLDTLTLAEAGVAMPIINMRTNRVMTNEDGSAVSITLLGRHSETFRLTMRQIGEKRSEMLVKNEPVDAAHREKEDIATLIACTRNWTIKRLGKQDFPCTPANIQRLWTDPRFRSLRETAMAFILADVNFLPLATSSSSGSLDTSSFSTGPSPVVADLSAARSAAIA